MAYRPKRPKLPNNDHDVYEERNEAADRFERRFKAEEEAAYEIAPENDEEISEDGAFDAEDEKKYGSALKQIRKSAKRGGQKNKARASSHRPGPSHAQVCWT